MPDTPSITIVKAFNYRGQLEQWSNKYHFSGTVPANPAAWLALGKAIWQKEATFLASSVVLNSVYGYEAGNENAVALFGPDGLGTVTPSTGSSTGSAPPGDVAAWVRWATPDRGSSGKPIYLRKYFHAVPGETTDLVRATDRTAMATYAAAMTDGTLPGGVKVCGPQGAVAGTVKVGQYLTTRTLKRRGKRPSS